MTGTLHLVKTKIDTNGVYLRFQSVFRNEAINLLSMEYLPDNKAITNAVKIIRSLTNSSIEMSLEGNTIGLCTRVEPEGDSEAVIEAEVVWLLLRL